eukprot:SAG11_NODE_7037_length_1204_cov_1.990045_1_plen_124_part_00
MGNNNKIHMILEIFTNPNKNQKLKVYEFRTIKETQFRFSLFTVVVGPTTGRLAIPAHQLRLASCTLLMWENIQKRTIAMETAGTAMKICWPSSEKPAAPPLASAAGSLVLWKYTSMAKMANKL